MRLAYSSFLFCALLCACKQEAPVAEVSVYAPSAQALNEGAQRIQADVAYLASDAHEGRAAGSPGFDQAAEYVATRFKNLGLEPAGDNGTYFQRVPLLEALRQQAGASLKLQQDNFIQEFIFEKEFLPGVNFNAPSHSVTAPLVFVGQGVFAPEFKHNDFAGVVLRDKIAVIFDGAPENFPITQRAFYSSRNEKLRQLSERGAIGVLYISNPKKEEKRPWSMDSGNWAIPGMRLVDKSGMPIDSFPQLQASASVNLSATRKILDGGKFSADVVFDQLKNGKLQAFDLPGMLTMSGTTQLSTLESRNVVAKLPGSSPQLSSENLVFSAHLDHLGIGMPVKGDAIYNGALDNALGVGIMLEAARSASLLSTKPKRSMIFIALTGEEKGLLGADYYAKNPTVPKSSIVANINMDMPVVLTELLDVVTIGVDHSSLQKQVEQAATEIGFLLSPDPAPDEVVFVRSDQFAFVRQGIPAVYLDGGVIAKDPNIIGKDLLENFLKTHYHKPSDDLKQPIHYATAAKMAALNARIGQLVADDPYRPRWNLGDFLGQKFAGQP
ncbi:MAG TPA: M28 family metallopeptidase [Arenimonas sp.]|nr:M28 family metallopeptidase [Arenimonas sp.]